MCVKDVSSTGSFSQLSTFQLIVTLLIHTALIMVIFSCSKQLFSMKALINQLYTACKQQTCS